MTHEPTKLQSLHKSAIQLQRLADNLAQQIKQIEIWGGSRFPYPLMGMAMIGKGIGKEIVENFDSLTELYRDQFREQDVKK